MFGDGTRERSSIPLAKVLAEGLKATASLFFAHRSAWWASSRARWLTERIGASAVTSSASLPSFIARSTSYLETRREEMRQAMLAKLRKLDGPLTSSVARLTGISPEDIERLGGISEDV